MDGIVVAGSVGTFKSVHKGWPVLGVERKREVKSCGSYQPLDVGSTNGARIPFLKVQMLYFVSSGRKIPCTWC
jgi:hypothetical protein